VLNAHKVGRPAATTTANWGPVSPKNHPTRSLAYSLNTADITLTRPFQGLEKNSNLGQLDRRPTLRGGTPRGATRHARGTAAAG
jgi:hypothetical protein